MAAHNELGKLGEQLATEHLIEKGYTILEQNWRNRFEEIDIIATIDQFLVIVEVKTRRNLNYGNPEDAVSLKKQRLLVNAAEVYINQKNSTLETRFDIISIVAHDENHAISHIMWAFSPFD
jgi:putative endonuclease